MDNNQNTNQNIDNQPGVDSNPPTTLNPAAAANTQQTDEVNKQTQTDQTPKDEEDGSGKKIIATIFGILVLIVGVAAGVFLVQREQEFREKAASGSRCTQHPDCRLFDEPGNSGSNSVDRPISHIFITAKEFHRFDSPGNNDGCYDVKIDGNAFSWSRVGDGPDCKDVSNVQVWMAEKKITPTPVPTKPPGATPSPTPTGILTPTLKPTLPPRISAQCNGVEVYDLNWNILSQDDLSKLQPGDTIHLLVSGTASTGTFDKARFTVNGNALPETTTKRPGTDKFFIEYQIPENIANFKVSGEIHHSTLGWF